MCGLYGVIGDTLTKQDLDIFIQLSIVSSLRGSHSTGVACVWGEKYYQHKIAKSVGHPYNLFDTKRFDIATTPINKRILIGHGRYATKGKVNEANAHPFSAGNIIGAHNGTIDYGLEKAFDFDTDSECVMNRFNETGVETVVPKLVGAWAFTWFDYRNTSFNILRNNKRTLYYALNKTYTKMYYASEMEMLDLVLNRNNVDYNDDVFIFAEDTLYSWDIPANVNWYGTQEEKIIKGEEVKVTPATPFHERTTTETTTKISGQTPSTVIKDIFKGHYNKTNLRTRNIGGIKQGFRSSIISVERYNTLLNAGCCWCSSTISTGDKYQFISHDDVLCEACVDNPQTRQEIVQYSPSAFL